MATGTSQVRGKPTKDARRLTNRALNRALLARQFLLYRHQGSPADVVTQLVGMQAQVPGPPFVGVWTRLAGFTRQQLVEAIDRREMVRGTLMRGTLHLVTRDDFLVLRPALQPMLSRAVDGVLGGVGRGLDRKALVAAARHRFAKGVCSFAVLRDHLAARFPGLNERAMGFLVRMELPLVQVPAAGAAWAYPATADFAVAESWMGCKLTAGADIGALALRYLGAFGPASARDFQVWSGLQGARDVFDRLAPRLASFQTDDAGEVFDLPDAPRPDEDTVAPPRYLPAFDNVLLSHLNRRRIVADEHKPRVITKNLIVPPTFLVDGFVAGAWKAEAKKDAATLTLTPFRPMKKVEQRALAAEGEPLLRFLEPDRKSYRIEILS